MTDRDPFWETCPRPQYCPYCGAKMEHDRYWTTGYCMGGVGDYDSFCGRCETCGKIVDVFMNADNYDERTLGEFKTHGFMLDDDDEPYEGNDV